MEQKYNKNNPAVKRILTELRELNKTPSPHYTAHIPDENNIFEWHFTIRGPPDTSFEGGIYHGRIILPPEYPFKPPNIILLTPNGRFEVGVKICLSISAHHPEHWQPSWSIRTVLIALIGFMPTAGGGAVGALDYPDSERRALAKQSTSWVCPKCGSHNATALPDPGAGNLTPLTDEEGQSDSPPVVSTPPESPPAPAPVPVPAPSEAVLPLAGAQQQQVTQTIVPNNTPFWLNSMIAVLFVAIFAILIRKACG